MRGSDRREGREGRTEKREREKSKSRKKRIPMKGGRKGERE